PARARSRRRPGAGARDANERGRPGVQLVPGIVDADADADAQVRALAAAEQVARRELGAARDAFDLAVQLVGDGVDADARRRAHADAADLGLGDEDVRVRVVGVGQRDGRRADRRHLAQLEVDVQHLAGAVRAQRIAAEARLLQRDLRLR